MTVIFYSPEKDEKTEAVRRVLENVSSAVAVETYHSIDRLRSRIMHPLYDVVLALIRLSMPSDLVRLVEMKDRFELLDVIIMDTGEGTGVDGSIHMLMPRFVFNVDDNPQVIGLVLKKMLDRKMARPSYHSTFEGREEDECKRKEYIEAHGVPPSNDMMPNGRYIPSNRQTVEYELEKKQVTRQRRR